jgi:hypothetical protein
MPMGMINIINGGKAKSEFPFLSSVFGSFLAPSTGTLVFFEAVVENRGQSIRLNRIPRVKGDGEVV